MAAFAESTPCWVDVSLPDLAAGKRFYGELFGWTFGEDSGAAYGHYTEAFSDGRRVAGLVAKKDGRMPTVWGVYFATSDAVGLSERIVRAGGRTVRAPTAVGPFGVMAQAADPAGAVFGLWQSGEGWGFEKKGLPGSFCWTELYTRDKERVDPFYETVLGFRGTDLPGASVDFRIWSPAGTEQAAPGTEQAATGIEQAAPGTEFGAAGAEEGPRGAEGGAAGTEPARAGAAFGGRSVITDAFPAEMPAHFLVYFCVSDCDTTAGTVVRLGGRITTPPFDIEHGRMAAVMDNQGAVFAVLAERERPRESVREASESGSEPVREAPEPRSGAGPEAPGPRSEAVREAGWEAGTEPGNTPETAPGRSTGRERARRWIGRAGGGDQ
ncbi:VOC family protein [Streptomyces sp. NPDC088341]|uniref:VOC family protein n=1 Tax=Streptomyces sp. NPDC088341 TaxID=3154870 RepID=UPI0034298383